MSRSWIVLHRAASAWPGSTKGPRSVLPETASPTASHSSLLERTSTHRTARALAVRISMVRSNCRDLNAVQAVRDALARLPAPRGDDSLLLESAPSSRLFFFIVLISVSLSQPILVHDNLSGKSLYQKLSGFRWKCSR